MNSIGKFVQLCQTFIFQDKITQLANNYLSKYRKPHYMITSISTPTQLEEKTHTQHTPQKVTSIKFVHTDSPRTRNDQHSRALPRRFNGPLSNGPLGASAAPRVPRIICAARRVARVCRASPERTGCSDRAASFHIHVHVVRESARCYT